MQTKLTLRMDDRVVAKAKGIAKQRRQSVSKMMEEHIINVSSLKGKTKEHPVQDWIQQIWNSNEEWRRKNKRKARASKQSDEDARYQYLKKKYS
ncbi:MAG: DUF6364 family protein [Chitinophagales bacterium]|nr:DUF6364 family protein [Chitinophagales bacterium]